MSQELLPQILRLYAADWSYSAIGAQVGLTENQVAGLIDRAKKRAECGARGKAQPATLMRGRTKPPATPAPTPAAKLVAAPPPAIASKPTVQAPRPMISPAPAVPPVLRQHEGCRYPIGDPREPGFHFCEAAKKPGSSYCPEHHAACWVRRKRHEGAEEDGR